MSSLAPLNPEGQESVIDFMGKVHIKHIHCYVVLNCMTDLFLVEQEKLDLFNA